METQLEPAVEPETVPAEHPARLCTVAGVAIGLILAAVAVAAYAVADGPSAEQSKLFADWAWLTLGVVIGASVALLAAIIPAIGGWHRMPWLLVVGAIAAIGVDVVAWKHSLVDVDLGVKNAHPIGVVLAATTLIALAAVVAYAAVLWGGILRVRAGVDAQSRFRWATLHPQRLIPIALATAVVAGLLAVGVAWLVVANWVH
ncbi:hypothetical protein [Gordonia sp. (in: high G+C Gram-positive bacteria)]|uniref:hypothetical protein n=1 Tax=Gordonia sp. (in: high G+C Gram-positive bacteria) TaxID=84139 RepID=UPI0039E45FFD